MRRNHSARVGRPSVRVYRWALVALVLLSALGVSRLLALEADGITRVSVNSAGQPANGDSFFAALSAGGEAVAFKSDASNLDSPQPDQVQFDIYVHDRVTGETKRQSVDRFGFVGNDNSFPATLSGDGLLVAFGSDASNLLGAAGDTNGGADVFVRNRVDGSIRRVSTTTLGAEVLGDTREVPPSFSSDGRFIAFETTAHLVPDDPHTGLIADAYLRDLDTGIVELMSRRLLTMDAPAAYAPGISGDGCVVAFVSASKNLIPTGQDTDDHLDVYARNRCSDPPLTERISINFNGTSRNFGPSQASLLPPSLNEDGSLVAFDSDAENLLPGDNNNVTDVYVRDRIAGATTRISVDSYGNEANGASSSPSMSSDGRYVVFNSTATNLLPNLSPQRLGNSDIYVRDLQTQQTCRVSGPQVAGEPGDSVNPTISRDGGWIAFESTAQDLVSDGNNGFRQIYVVANRTDLQECPPTATPTHTSSPTVTPTSDGSTATPTPTGPSPTPTETSTPGGPTATPTAQSCTNTEDCPEGQVCIGGMCQNPQPCDSTDDCPTGLVCVNNMCIEPPPCETTDDCPGDLVCVNNMCIPPPPCETTDDCPGDLVCVNEMCVPPPPCDTTDDCPGGLVCVNEMCVPPPPCDTTDDCPGGLVCVNDMCVPPPPCEVQGDCPSDLVCVNMMCVPPPPCDSQEDCPPDLVCENGECMRPIPCDTTDDCPPGQICNTETHTCVSGPTPTATAVRTRTPTPTEASGGGNGGGGCNIQGTSASGGSSASGGFLLFAAPLGLIWLRGRRRRRSW